MVAGLLVPGSMECHHNIREDRSSIFIGSVPARCGKSCFIWYLWAVISGRNMAVCIIWYINWNPRLVTAERVSGPV